MEAWEEHRSQIIFDKRGAVLTSHSTPRFRDQADLTASLQSAGFRSKEIDPPQLRSPLPVHHSLGLNWRQRRSRRRGHARRRAARVSAIAARSLKLVLGCRQRPEPLDRRDPPAYQPRSGATSAARSETARRAASAA